MVSGNWITSKAFNSNNDFFIHRGGRRVLYGNILFGEKINKLSVASKIFTKVGHIAGNGNGGK